jgi:hypothetical protein
MKLLLAFKSFMPRRLIVEIGSENWFAAGSQFGSDLLQTTPLWQRIASSLQTTQFRQQITNSLQTTQFRQ